MILKASERANGQNLAAHLLNHRENDVVEIHEMKGFIRQDLPAAFQEIEAQSKGTRCKNYLFSLSLSPPPDADADIQIFESTIKNIENELNLNNQPRAIIFHEKHGRRHAHVVWSRIDVKQMKAIPMSHYKNKLNVIAKEVYLEQGWQLPEGFIDRTRSNPLNFTLAQWQQAKRLEQDPRILKLQLQESWARAPAKASFEQLLQKKGFHLAQGDRRGYVAVDWRGEVFSLTRWLGVKKKDLKIRLGSYEILPTVAETQSNITQHFQANWQSFTQALQKEHQAAKAPLAFEKQALLTRHIKERSTLKEQQNKAFQQEKATYHKNIKKGMRGLWARITGTYRREKDAHAMRLYQMQQNHQNVRDAQIFTQLQEQKAIYERLKTLNQMYEHKRYELQSSIKQSLGAKPSISLDFNL